MCGCFWRRGDMSVSRKPGCVCGLFCGLLGFIWTVIEVCVCVCVCTCVGGCAWWWVWDHDSQTWLFEEVYSSSGQDDINSDCAVRLTFLFNFCIMEKFQGKYKSKRFNKPCGPFTQLWSLSTHGRSCFISTQAPCYFEYMQISYYSTISISTYG